MPTLNWIGKDKVVNHHLDVPFRVLMDKLIQLGLDRARRRSRMTFSYDTNLLASYSENSAKGAKGAKR